MAVPVTVADEIHVRPFVVGPLPGGGQVIICVAPRAAIVATTVPLFVVALSAPLLGEADALLALFK